MDENPSFNPEQFKVSARESWNRAARGWNEHTPQIHQWLAGPTQAMLDQAKVKSGFRVLDESAQDAAWREIEERLQAFQTPTGWDGPNELLLTVGRR